MRREMDLLRTSEETGLEIYLKFHFSMEREM